MKLIIDGWVCECNLYLQVKARQNEHVLDVGPIVAYYSMSLNILDIAFIPEGSSYSHPDNDNSTFVHENVLFEFQHTFLFNTVFMAIIYWILDHPVWRCQFTPAACQFAPVVNFIFLNKTKTGLPEVLSICVELLCIYMLQPSSCQLSWLRWRWS